jgi:7-keto-8-aminopelargonate synthetase-like enzyme
MNEKYKTLFALIAQNMENIAERAMEDDKANNDMQAYKTAKEMRSKYARLHDLLTSKTVDYTPVKNDIIDLYIGANLITQQIEARVKREQAALQAYRLDLIPKLEKAMKNEDEIEKIFTIQEESNN